MYDDILSLKKRIESLASAVYNMKANDDGPNVTPQKMLPYDTSKFVDYSTFNEFKANMMREFDNVHLNISELRKLIDEIFLILKTKISDKEMKNLEDFLFIKLEEFKSACNKKFADKNETARNLKYLEQQIKNILETYLKKMEKGDNWLLAKKPIGGNSCASCEAYIGDLHDNSQYIPWNKYPMRDPNDKLYRIGNGFSKMLQMLNVEQLQQNRSPGAFKTTQDFYKPNFEGQEKKNSALPKINNLNQSLNMSADDVEVEEDVEIEDPNRPKM